MTKPSQPVMTKVTKQRRPAPHLWQARRHPAVRLLAYALSAVLVLQPTMTLAGGTVPLNADPNAAAANRPGIGAAANGVPLVNIVAPNGAGLSHNKYADFNVGTPGLILNNANQTLTQSQLGGLVPGNPNLAGTGTASVILNEVTGSSRTVLQGAIEVNGRAAGVIIANQNGLTCDGCGFINAPRVTLSTGSPVAGADGAIASLRVEGGDILIGANGANATTVNVFDLVSRSISAIGSVAAGGLLNLIAGRNSVAYQTGVITPLGPDGKEPGIAIDSSALGGMYAGQIKIVATDKGAGVNMGGTMVANAADMTLAADGKLTLSNAQAAGPISAQSVGDSVAVTGTLYTSAPITLQGLTGIALADNALVVSASDLTMTTGGALTVGDNAIAASGTTSDGVQTATGTLSVQAGTLSVGNGLLAGGALLSIAAATLDLARGSDDGQDSLRALGDVNIAASRVNAANARITAGSGLVVHSDGALTLNGGTYLAGGDLLAEAASLTTGASLGAQGTATARATGGSLANSGQVAGNAGTLATATGNLTNTGQVVSTGDVTVAAGGSLINGTGGLIAANGNVSATAATLGNDGTILSQGGTLSVTTQGGLANNGTLLSLAAANIVSAGNLTSAGEITAAGDLSVAVGGTLSVAPTGQLLSGGAMTLTGLNGGAMGGLTVATGGLINGAALLGINSASLNNAGEVGSAYGGLLAQVAGDITNTGTLYAATNAVYQLDGTFANTNASVIAEGTLVIQGLTGARAAAIDNASGTIEAVAGDLGLAADNITNRVQGGVTVTTTSNTTTSTVGPVQVDSITTRTTVTTVTTTDEYATLNGVAGQLLAGGNMLIDAGANGTLTNSYSQIAANADLTINAGTVTNEGRDLIETISTTTVNNYDVKHCGWTIFGSCEFESHDYSSDPPVNTTTTSTIGSVYATIQAGGNLIANVSGYVDNNAVRGQAGQIGLTSGDRAMDAVDITGPASTLTGIQTTATVLLSRQAMFGQVTDPDAPFLIETRSAFIDPNQFLGSDYFLRLIGYDPAHSTKRLGDAYVEYQAIENQIFELTGRNSLGSNDPAAQIQALYDNAAYEQRQLGLTVGTPLTPAQIAGLSKDIVWLETQTVNGQQVLVPRVYLSASTLAVTSLASAQVKAGGVAVIMADSLSNSGAVITGGGLGIQTTGDVVNTGGGLYSAGDIVVQAGGNFANRSGVVAGDNVAIVAGGNVGNDTVSVRDTYGAGAGAGSQQSANMVRSLINVGGGTPLPGMSSADNYGDRQQQIGVISAQGGLLVQAAGDVTAQGGQFVSGGDMTLVAGNDITLNPLTLNSASRITFDGGYARSANTTNIGAVLVSGGDMTLAAGNDLSATAAQASAGGLLTVVAGRDIALSAGTDQSLFERQTSNTHDYFVGSSTTNTYDYRNATTSVPTSFTGGSVAMAAGRDIGLVGSSVTGQGDVALQAGGNVTLASTIDTSTVTHNSETTTSGFMAAPTTGAWGFAIGSRDVRDQSTTTTLSNMASLVGSVGGNVAVLTNGDFSSNASVLAAPSGDLTVVANSIAIAAGIDSTTTQTSHDDHFSGLIVTVGGGPGSPLKNVQQVMNFERAAGKTKDPRAQTLYQIAEAGQAISAVYSLATGGVIRLLSVQATIGFGVNDSHWQSSSHAEQATSTQFVAGGAAALQATGTDLTLRGVSLQANDVRLSAANDVDLLSLAVNSGYDASSTYSSSLIGITLSASLKPEDAAGGGGFGFGAGVTARLSNSQSQSHDEKTSYVPTVVTGANSVSIDSGRDTSVLGAQVYGGKVDLTVGRDLAIVSDQNTETQTASQSSWSLGGTLGMRAGGIPYGSISASESSGKASGNYISVVNQAGLYAGDGGFNVNVGGVTTLTGAALASTADASLNSLTTGALVTSDLQNSSSWNASSSGFGFSLGMTGSKPGETSSRPGIGGLQPSLPQNESGSSSGTAVASIAPGAINILDPATQKMLTGMTPDQAKAAVDRAAAAQNKEADTLPNLSQTLQNQAARTAAFGAASSTTANLVGTFANAEMLAARKTINELNNQLKANGGLTPEQQQQYADAQAAYDAWNEGGAARVLLHGITQGVLAGIGGGSATVGLEGGLGAAAGAAIGPRIADAVNQALKDAGLSDGGPSTLGNLVSQLVATGIGAAIGGGAGAATAASVHINNFELTGPQIKAIQKLVAQGNYDTTSILAVQCYFNRCSQQIADLTPEDAWAFYIKFKNPSNGYQQLEDTVPLPGGYKLRLQYKTVRIKNPQLTDAEYTASMGAYFPDKFNVPATIEVQVPDYYKGDLLELERLGKRLAFSGGTSTSMVPSAELELSPLGKAVRDSLATVKVPLFEGDMDKVFNPMSGSFPYRKVGDLDITYAPNSELNDPANRHLSPEQKDALTFAMRYGFLPRSSYAYLDEISSNVYGIDLQTGGLKIGNGGVALGGGMYLCATGIGCVLGGPVAAMGAVSMFSGGNQLFNAGDSIPLVAKNTVDSLVAAGNPTAQIPESDSIVLLTQKQADYYSEVFGTAITLGFALTGFKSLSRPTSAVSAADLSVFDPTMTYQSLRGWSVTVNGEVLTPITTSAGSSTGWSVTVNGGALTPGEFNPVLLSQMVGEDAAAIGSVSGRFQGQFGSSAGNTYTADIRPTAAKLPPNPFDDIGSPPNQSAAARLRNPFLVGDENPTINASDLTGGELTVTQSTATKLPPSPFLKGEDPPRTQPPQSPGWRFFETAPQPENLTIQNLSENVNPDINPNIIRPVTDRFLNRYGTPGEGSVVVIEVRDADGVVRGRAVALNAKTYSGNAPNEIMVNGKEYKVIRADSGSVPSYPIPNLAETEIYGNSNHADMKVFSWLRDNFSGRKVIVEMAVQNSSQSYQGMCPGCGQAARWLAVNEENFTIHIFQDSIGTTK